MAWGNIYVLQIGFLQTFVGQTFVYREFMLLSRHDLSEPKVQFLSIVAFL